jgi:hypothetical protein
MIDAFGLADGFGVGVVVGSHVGRLPVGCNGSSSRRDGDVSRKPEMTVDWET